MRNKKTAKYYTPKYIFIIGEMVVPGIQLGSVAFYAGPDPL